MGIPHKSFEHGPPDFPLLLAFLLAGGHGELYFGSIFSHNGVADQHQHGSEESDQRVGQIQPCRRGKKSQHGNQIKTCQNPGRVVEGKPFGGKLYTLLRVGGQNGKQGYIGHPDRVPEEVGDGVADGDHHSVYGAVPEGKPLEQVGDDNERRTDQHPGAVAAPSAGLYGRDYNAVKRRHYKLNGAGNGLDDSHEAQRNHSHVGHKKGPEL